MQEKRGFFTDPNHKNLNNPKYQVAQRNAKVHTSVTSAGNLYVGKKINVGEVVSASTTTTTTISVPNGESDLVLDATGVNYTYYIYDKNGVKSNVVNTGIPVVASVNGYGMFTDCVYVVYYYMGSHFFKSIDFDGGVLQIVPMTDINNSYYNIEFYKNQGYVEYGNNYYFFNKNTYAAHSSTNVWISGGDYGIFVFDFDLSLSTYQYFVFGDTMSGVKDSGISISNIGPSNVNSINSGWAILFQNNNDSTYIWQFINSVGNILLNLNCGNDFNNYNFTFNYYIFCYYSGSDLIIYYFDGINYFHNTFVNSTLNSIGSNYNQTLDKGFVAFISSGGITGLYYLNNGTATHIFNKDPNYTYSVQTYWNLPYSWANYIVSVVHNTNTGYYDSIDFFSKTGTLLQSVSLIGQNIIGYDTQFFGVNKFSILLNGGGNGYSFVYYDGTTNTLLTKSVSSNYTWIDWNETDESIFYILAEGSPYNSSRSYLAFLPIFDGDTSISDPIIINNGSVNTIMLRSSVVSNDYLLFPANIDDGKIYQAVVTKSGVTYNDTGLLITNLSGIDSYIAYHLKNYSFCAYLYHQSFTASSNLVFITNGPTGSISQSLTLPNSDNSINYSWSTGLNFAIIDFKNDVAYYLNSTTNNQFVMLNESYTNIIFGNSYLSFIEDGFLLYDKAKNNFRLMSSTKVGPLVNAATIGFGSYNWSVVPNSGYQIRFYESNWSYFYDEKLLSIKQDGTIDTVVSKRINDMYDSNVYYNFGNKYYIRYHSNGSSAFVYYFNGTNAFTHSFPNSYLNFGSNYDNTLDFGFIVWAYNTVTNIPTIYYLDGNGGVTELFTADTTNYDYSIFTRGQNDYNAASFIAIVRHSRSTGHYSDIQIIGKSGSLLQSFDLSGYGFTSFSNQFYGINKFSCMFGGDGSNYVVVNYDGNFDRFGVNEQYFASSNYEWFTSDNIIIYLFFSGGVSSSNGFNYYNYLSYIPIYGGDSSIRPQVDINTGTPTVGINWPATSVTENYSSILVNLGDGYVHQIVVSKTSTITTNTTIVVNTLNGWSFNRSFSNFSVIVLGSDGPTTWCIVNDNTGDISQVLSLAWYYNLRYNSYGYNNPLLLINDYSVAHTYYINSSTNYQFVTVPGSIYYGDYYKQFCFDNYKNGSYMMYDWNNNSNNYRILNSSSITNNFYIPVVFTWAGLLIRFCNGFVMNSYRDNNFNDYITIYDTNGNLLQYISAGNHFSSALSHGGNVYITPSENEISMEFGGDGFTDIFIISKYKYTSSRTVDYTIVTNNNNNGGDWYYYTNWC